jgi:transcriptional regulator with XRE-family HTH domain
MADRSHGSSRSERIWEQRRALGRRLAALRSRAGFSQWEFAPLTGYSRSTLSDAELGRHRLRREFWQRCDDALRADGALIAAYDRIEVQASAARRSARSQAQAAREEQASQRLHALLPDVPGPAREASPAALESPDPEAPRTVVERCPHCRQPVTVMIVPAPRTS